ncbi:MAG: arabinan endo-1,5-alpha-L-arabinosidase, partial [Acidimicrobiia bacterium]
GGEDPTSAPGRPAHDSSTGREPAPASPPLVTDPEGPVRVPVSGDTTWVHDPSIAREDGTYHLYSTHDGIQHRTSTDLQHWTRAAPVFAEPPAWLTQEAPVGKGDIWAPDISRWGGRWHLYYSTSEFPAGSLPTRNSAIGHATAVTLDPSSPDGGWTDHGPVLRSRGQLLDADRSGWNAIDPAVVLDDDDRPWLTWGSNYDGLFLQPLQPDGTLDPSVPPVNLARRELVTDNIEAPTILKRGDWWYLFASFDLCCFGMNSTYNVRVGRSASLTGPYVDRDGRPMLDGGGTKVLAAYGNVLAPGHQTVLHEGDNWWLIHHWYNPAHDARPELGIRPLDWDADGWPVARGWSPATL